MELVPTSKIPHPQAQARPIRGTATELNSAAINANLPLI
jgi:hypothetical protein